MKNKFTPKTTTNELEDELNYCQKVIDVVEKEEAIHEYPKVKEKLNYLKEIVEDHQEHLQLSNDPDARVGHKTADSSFFGYKTHSAMNEERIITAAIITNSEKSDGKQLQTLIEKSRKTGMKNRYGLGDTAYSEKENIQYANQNDLQLISKLHPQIT